MDYQDYLQRAITHANDHHADAPLPHKVAFANSVQYLCTGGSGGIGGPSIREHLCSRLAAGPNAQYSGMLIYPDGTLPRPGEWGYESAIALCAPICFGPIEDYLDMAKVIIETEYCFDDDPADIAALKVRRCKECGEPLAPQAKGDWCTPHRHLDPARKAAVKRAKKKAK